VRIIKENLSKFYGVKILDVGTGRGDFIKLLTENLKGYDKIVGIDSHEEIKKRFEDLKEWMNKYGLAGATQLMIIGKK